MCGRFYSQSVELTIDSSFRTSKIAGLLSSVLLDVGVLVVVACMSEFLAV